MRENNKEKVKVRVTNRGENQVVSGEGTYAIVNGNEYVRYEAGDAITTLKISESSLELSRKGDTSSHMYFEVGTIKEILYETQYGTLCFEIDTKKLDIAREEKRFTINLSYAMKQGGEPVSDMDLEIVIRFV